MARVGFWNHRESTYTTIPDPFPNPIPLGAYEVSGGRGRWLVTQSVLVGRLMPPAGIGQLSPNGQSTTVECEIVWDVRLELTHIAGWIQYGRPMRPGQSGELRTVRLNASRTAECTVVDLKPLPGVEVVDVPQEFWDTYCRQHPQEKTPVHAGFWTRAIEAYRASLASAAMDALGSRI